MTQTPTHKIKCQKTYQIFYVTILIRIRVASTVNSNQYIYIYKKILQLTIKAIYCTGKKLYSSSIPQVNKKTKLTSKKDKKENL